LDKHRSNNPSHDEEDLSSQGEIIKAKKNYDQKNVEQSDAKKKPHPSQKNTTTEEERGGEGLPPRSHLDKGIGRKKGIRKGACSLSPAKGKTRTGEALRCDERRRGCRPVT